MEIWNDMEICCLQAPVCSCESEIVKKKKKHLFLALIPLSKNMPLDYSFIYFIICANLGTEVPH